MRITTKDRSAKLTKTDLIAVLATEGDRPELPEGHEIPKGIWDDFQGRFRQAMIQSTSAGTTPRVLLLGLGKEDELDLERLRRIGALAAKASEGRKLGKISMIVPAALEEALGAGEVAAALAEGLVMGSYNYDDARGKKPDRHLKAATLIGGGAAFKKGAAHGVATAEGNAHARDLQNAPANRMTPRLLAKDAQALAKRSPRITAKVMDEAAMKRMGMGALLGVSLGSAEPARLIHLTYKPAKKKRGAKKVALVGKGLTFDAGGISIKPAGKMWDMKYDMSGGAAVLGVFHALADLDIPHEVHGVVPASENLLGAAAQRPSDVVTAMNGKTIEVLNTDAEGRLILADALCYTVDKIKPDTIVDLATLTGAVIVALGHELSGMFASSEALESGLRAAGDHVGEPVWPLPLLDIHKEQMKGTISDLKNINDGGLGNGSTAGAAFLSNFVGDTEWCHLDIAGTAWGTRNRDWVGGSLGSGVGTRLLVRWLEQLGS